jgi:formylglycine-generating enzyme required for sulfatase activity
VRVYRGGSWGFVGGEARAAFRGNVFQPSQRSYLVGFRLARTPAP